MAKQPKVDPNLCIGCQTCVSLAAKSFTMSEQGKSEAVVPAGDDEATIQNAIDSCPVGAISWEEEAGK
jgi:ferredoxin